MRATAICVEQSVLVAVLDQDLAECDRLLGDFLPNELRSLELACERLASRVGHHLLLAEHEAGEHAGMARPAGNWSDGFARPGGVNSRALGCPKCHEVAGFEPPLAMEGGW